MAMACVYGGRECDGCGQCWQEKDAERDNYSEKEAYWSAYWDEHWKE